MILRAALLASLCVGLVLECPAVAARFALLVGNNGGAAGDPHLRFAESDSRNLEEVLRRLGGFSSGGSLVLRAGTADDLRGAIDELRARLIATPGKHLVLVYYSGHADAQALHLGASSFPLLELAEIIGALPAATRVLILDACQTGVLTRVKGGRQGLGFERSIGEATKGFAILASSAGSEMAQESDELGASVFTHHLLLGLSGLADRDHDGEVSLSEVFDYASERTLTTTMGTTSGPQHPTFRWDLAGREILILTRPGSLRAGYGRLRLDVAGWYFVRRADGTMAAEVASHGDETLAMEPGSYQITRRERDRLDVAAVDITEGGTTAISRAASRAVGFGEMVRKGGDRAAAYELTLATTAQTALEHLGPSLGAALVGRVDLRPLSFELQVALERASQASEHFSSTTWNFSPSVNVLRMHDLAKDSGPPTRLSWGFGMAAGAAHLSQRFDTGESRPSWNPFAGPIVVMEVAVGRRFFLRAAASLLLYGLRVQMAEGSAIAWRPALASALGGGASF